MTDGLIVSGAGPNTLISYRYTDASNYKLFDDFVLRGAISQDQVDKMVATLSSDGFFLPGQVGMPYLTGKFEHGGGWDEDADHPWHEIEAIALTDKAPTGDLSVADLLAAWPARRFDWDSIEAEERLRRSLPEQQAPR